MVIVVGLIEEEWATAKKDPKRALAVDGLSLFLNSVEYNSVESRIV